MSNSLKNSKPGRNDPCPCGSGKKFKNCCLYSAPKKKFGFRRLHPSEVPQELKRKIREDAHKEAQWKQKFGSTKPMIHMDFKGFKMVAVGSELHWVQRLENIPRLFDELYRY